MGQNFERAIFYYFRKKSDLKLNLSYTFDAMVKMLYSVLMTIADLLFKLISLFHPKARKIVKGRKHDKTRILNPALNISGQVIWFHCASLGEWEQTIPVVNAIKNESNFKIIVSFYSPSGYENAKSKELADLIFYLPADIASNYDFIYKKFDIKVLVFCRYDLWPALIWKAKNNNVKLVLIGAEVKSGNRYLKKNSFFGRLLSMFDYISCNDLSSYQLFLEHGFSQSHFDGAPKIERALFTASNPFQNADLDAWAEGHQVIVAGSVWPAEIGLIGQWAKLNKGQGIKWIIAPHEPGPSYYEAVRQIFGNEVIEYSRFNDTQWNKEAILIDSIGLLSKLYNFADLAIVGGGFGKGIHNILEPAAYGIPVIAGSNYSKFSEAEILKQKQIFYPVRDFVQFNDAVKVLLFDTKIRSKIRLDIDHLKEENSGVSKRISHKILNLISRNV